MYTNTSLDIIQDNAPYTDSSGTNYPSNWDKDTIAELFPVTLVTQPTEVVIEGFHIELVDVTYTQVWDTSALPAKTWTDVDNLQNAMFSINTEAAWRLTRYKEQLEFTVPATTETAASYQNILNYRQAIRDNDATTHATPDLAITALEALTLDAPIYT